MSAPCRFRAMWHRAALGGQGRAVMDEDHATARAATLHNLGVGLARAGDPVAALARFDAAIALRPDYAHAHVNRGGALHSLGRYAEAAEAYRAALALEPGLYEIHLRCGQVLLAIGRREEALAHFDRTRALRRDPAVIGDDHPSFAQTCRLKLVHDAAQLRYLETRGIETGLAGLYEAAVEDIAWPEDPAASIDIPPAWRHRLAGSYNRPIHAGPAPAVAGGAIRPGIAAAPGIAVIDDLLEPDALQALRRHLLESTIWHDFSHIGGFLAAYLEDGLASPLLLQIAAELRAALPELLGPHPLQQAWAFKCLTGAKGIDVHADSGAVSVNFWITPDSANCDPGAGGLIIHRAPPPEFWAVEDYAKDIVRIRRMIARSDQGVVEVPYAANRAAVFRSVLFHESGAVRFRPGYENQRINITLLYGEGEQDRPAEL